jgi:hypothetical protein
MKNIPDEKQLEGLLETDPPAPSGRIDSRLAAAPWTPRATARRRISTALSFAVLALAVLVAATPQGRAFATGVLHFFTHAGSDTLPAGTPLPVGWVDVTPGVPGPTRTPMVAFIDCGDYSLVNGPKCSVEQVRARVNFTVEELGTLPAGLQFVGATGGPDSIVILYATEDQNGWLYITEQPVTGSPDQTQVGASAVVETVQIGNASGEYVLGTFVHLMNEPTINWDPNAGIQTVRWADQGVLFEMAAVQSALMPKEAFVALAGTMTTGPVSANQPTRVPTAIPTSIDYYDLVFDLDLAQAEQQAGFTALQAGRLPEDLSFARAAYDPEHRILRTLYLEAVQPEPNKLGLVLSEQPIPVNGDCPLCGIVSGDHADILNAGSGMVVGTQAVIETVQVGNVTGHYVEGWWSPAGGSWVWVQMDVVKTLRWQADGMAFELQYTGSALSMADLITIAESLK